MRKISKIGVVLMLIGAFFLALSALLMSANQLYFADWQFQGFFSVVIFISFGIAFIGILVFAGTYPIKIKIKRQ